MNNNIPINIDTDMLLLKNELYDENNPNNPQENNMVIGKINNCYKRLKNEWVPILMDDTSITNKFMVK